VTVWIFPMHKTELCDIEDLHRVYWSLCRTSQCVDVFALSRLPTSISNNQGSKRSNNSGSSSQPMSSKAFRNMLIQDDRSMNMNNTKGSTYPSNMSECAARYAESIADPFEDKQACIPDFPALLTGRIHTFAKGTFATSTNGLAGGAGYIAISPDRGVANDANAGVINAPASSNSSLEFTANPALNTFIQTNSNYNTASFVAGNNQQYRIVSAGLRIRYIGSELVRGGQVVGMHHPAHYSLQTYNIGTLDAYVESSRLPVTRDWISVVYHPVDTDDLDWKTSPFPVNTPAVTDSCYYMGFMIQAPDTTGANPLSFEYEMHFNYELSGPLVLNKEVSHVDPVGHGAVNAAAMITETVRKPHNVPTKTVASGLVTAASHYIATHTSNPAKPPQHPASTSSNGSFWSTILKVGSSLLPSILSWL
jgi:hypothetical protein